MECECLIHISQKYFRNQDLVEISGKGTVTISKGFLDDPDGVAELWVNKKKRLRLPKGSLDWFKMQDDGTLVFYGKCDVRFTMTRFSTEDFHQLHSQLSKRPEEYMGHGIDPKRFYGDSLPENTTSSCVPTYFRQAPAVEHLDVITAMKGTGQGWSKPKLFSMESPKKGVRKFFVAGRKDFMDMYLGFSPLDRHVYEIIQEHSPCRLYYDLEYSKNSYNASVNGNELVDIVISTTAVLLFEKFRICIQRCNVIELDSSSDKKFSRHLIFHLPENKLFRNNRICGFFVQQVYNRSRAKLLVRDLNGELASFIDLGVYSRNRMFRLYLSTKFGKKSLLQPCNGRNTFPFDDETKETLMNFLEASFVCPHHTESIVLLPCDQEISRGGRRSVKRPRDPQKPSSNPSSIGETPYPLEEHKVLMFAGKFGRQPARTGSWRLTDNFLTLNLRDNRYCHNIGREHRSNNVYYCVDLKAQEFYQRCYDPECRHFKSKSWPLN